MNCSYTIKKSEVLKLAQAREIQTKDAAETHFRQTGENLTPKDAAACRDWANVRFVNGSTFELAVPIGKVAKWAGMLTATYAKRPVDEIAIEFEPANRIRLRCGPSEIAFYCSTAEDTREGVAKFNAQLGAHIPVIAPETGGEFTVQADTSSLKAKRAAVTAQRKDGKRRKEFAQARQTERHALASLKKLAADYVASLATLAAPVKWVIAGQYNALKARRMLRRALATPEILPAWYPETYQEEKSETVQRLNPDGSRMVCEVFRDFYDDKMKMAPYLATLGCKPEIPEHYYESEDVEFMATVDAREEFARFVAAVQTARQALADYKPRKLVSTARFTSHRSRRRGNVPKLKQDVLDAELASALANLDGLIRSTFRAEAKKNGFTDAANLASQYFTPAREYSRARLAIRGHAERKAAIVGRFMEARAQRMEIEVRNMAAGSIRARAIDKSGKPGPIVMVSATEIQRQFDKCAALGAAVEILESSNPQYPIGRVNPPAVTH